MSRPSILGLDLSLTATGYCRDGECGRIVTKLRGWERVACILQTVQDLAGDADVVVVEGYSFGSRGNTLFQIAELGGIVRFDLCRNGTPYVDVAPGTLKKYATGKGNAGKDEMIAAAIRRFGFEGSDNNEADAFLLWCMASHAYGEPVATVTQVQAEALAKVDWPALCAVAS
jgi:crossover junction endodeoxyribonuclease RuvC